MSRRTSDWMFYLNRDWWEYSKIQDLEDDVRQARREASRAHSISGESVDVLTDNLARSLLLVHTLIETLVRKGLVTREELVTTMNELDALDGQSDGKLAPGTLPGTVKPPPRSQTAEEFLRNLEKE